MKLLFGVDPVNWVNTEEQLHKYVPLEKALRCFDSNALDILEKMLPNKIKEKDEEARIWCRSK